MRTYTVSYKGKAEQRERVRIRRGLLVQEFLPSKKSYEKVPEIIALAAAETGYFTIKPEEGKS